MAPVLLSTPLGRSTATTVPLFLAFRYETASAKSPSTFRERPTPKSASTARINSPPSKSFHAVTGMPSRSAMSSCSCISGVYLDGSPTVTMAVSYPRSVQIRAIATPSAPLLPVPARIRSGCFRSLRKHSGNVFSAQSQQESAARSIKTSEGIPISRIACASISFI